MSYFPIAGRVADTNRVYAQPSRIAVPSTAGGIDIVAAAAAKDVDESRSVEISVPSIEAAGVFITFDDTAPTTASGFLIEPGDRLVLVTVQRVRAICAAGPINVHVLVGTPA